MDGTIPSPRHEPKVRTLLRAIRQIRWLALHANDAVYEPDPNWKPQPLKAALDKGLSEEEAREQTRELLKTIGTMTGFPHGLRQQHLKWRDRRFAEFAGFRALASPAAAMRAEQRVVKWSPELSRAIRASADQLALVVNYKQKGIEKFLRWVDPKALLWLAAFEHFDLVSSTVAAPALKRVARGEFSDELAKIVANEMRDAVRKLLRRPRRREADKHARRLQHQTRPERGSASPPEAVPIASAAKVAPDGNPLPKRRRGRPTAIPREHRETMIWDAIRGFQGQSEKLTLDALVMKTGIAKSTLQGSAAWRQVSGAKRAQRKFEAGRESRSWIDNMRTKAGDSFASED